MKTTLVVNPKGGSGKTTIAVNLASALAMQNLPVTLMDYDPQGSSLGWLRSRAPHAPSIHGANGAPERFGRLRSFEMYVPPQTRHLVIDAPAGAGGLLLQQMLDRAHEVLVPVVPSVIDIRASEAFIRDLLAMPKVRSGEARVGILANKVRVSMPAYQPLLRFLECVEVKLVARLLDSDLYVRAAENGVGIFELDPGQAAAERRQFTPIIDWVRGAEGPVDAQHEVRQIRRVGL
ncbi:MAG: chromosome partitioning protein [Burkholderiales bacterium]|jgi:chromosome partitioning protein|nr:chromosome partitioning protein [Burkholderiales bacterium]